MHLENKKEPIRPNRIGFDSTPEFKARLESQAEARGFDNYKSYLISLVERDRDILAGILKTGNKNLPKPKKSSK
jgi:DNA-binding MurR/RpiR family transcriptional regulator